MASKHDNNNNWRFDRSYEVFYVHLWKATKWPWFRTFGFSNHKKQLSKVQNRKRIESKVWFISRGLNFIVNHLMPIGRTMDRRWCHRHCIRCTRADRSRSRPNDSNRRWNCIRIRAHSSAHWRTVNSSTDRKRTPRCVRSACQWPPKCRARRRRVSSLIRMLFLFFSRVFRVWVRLPRVMDWSETVHCHNCYNNTVNAATYPTIYTRRENAIFVQLPAFYMFQ